MRAPQPETKVSLLLCQSTVLAESSEGVSTEELLPDSVVNDEDEEESVEVSVDSVVAAAAAAASAAAWTAA